VSENEEVEEDVNERRGEGGEEGENERWEREEETRAKR
jgi:hypothetical protein